jgi:hypothetical protein
MTTKLKGFFLTLKYDIKQQQQLTTTTATAK